MPRTSTLHDAFVGELRDLYNAEKQITRALPKMAKAASMPSLAQAFQRHLEETQEQIERLEQVFESIGETPKSKTCHGITGILEEGKAIMDESFDDATMDASLIAAAQRVEHYEMAAYGTVAAWAKSMGHDKALKLLLKTLDEEKAADEKLNQIAEGGLNEQAAVGAHGEEEDEEEEEPARRGNGRSRTTARRPMAASRR